MFEQTRKCKLLHSMNHQCWHQRTDYRMFRFMELELTVCIHSNAFEIRLAFRPMVRYYTQTDYYPFDLSKLDRVQFLNKS